MVAAHPDRQLEEAILGAFIKERGEDVLTLRVVVNEGVAYIDGCVENYGQKKVVGRLAASAPGLRKVVNRLRVVPAAVVDDDALAERVRQAMEGRPSLAGQAISVRSQEGVIELSGTVGRPSLRLHAEDAAWSVSGVRQVLNKLVVSYASLPEERKLAQLIAQYLQDCLGLEPWRISVEVHKGAAYLRGSVPSFALFQAAEDLVRWHPHVRDVVNRLAVESTPSPRNYGLTA